MGKEGELWDDSALIDAFDHAISNYKKVHGKAQLDSSKAGEQDTNGTGEDLLTCVDETKDAKRQESEDSNKDIASHSKPDSQKSSDELPSEENQQESKLNSSYEENIHEGYPNTQGSEEYNQLINQYYEIEAQRQKIMQQLEPFNYWNFQQPVPQQYPITPGQISHPPYDSYINQCMVAPCYLGGTCTSVNSGIACNGKSTFIENDNVTKSALAAAEKAISSLKIENPEAHASVAGETDINTVLTSWYNAGFHTGKYLAEQSIAKKRQS